jgi:hypothetical protein
MRNKPGDKVLIIEDCREGGQAAGQIGIYEGDFPHTVVLSIGGEDGFLNGEWLFEDYESGKLVANGGTPIKDIYPLWEKGTPKPTGRFAMAMDNPRIRLNDGSVIWGCQCWWGDAATAPATLEEAQADLEKTKAFYRGIARAINAVTYPELELVRKQEVGSKGE